MPYCFFSYSLEQKKETSPIDVITRLANRTNGQLVRIQVLRNYIEFDRPNEQKRNMLTAANI